MPLSNHPSQQDGHEDRRKLTDHVPLIPSISTDNASLSSGQRHFSFEDPTFVPAKADESAPLVLDEAVDLEYNNPVFVSSLHRTRSRSLLPNFLRCFPRTNFFSKSPRVLRRFNKSFNGSRFIPDPSPPHFSKSTRLILLALLGAFAMLGLVHFITLSLGAFVAFFPDELDLVLATWGEHGQPSSGLKHWPTDFTADIKPVQCHSHNDYWRKVPLYEAISAGCVGVEADIWLFDEELYVGHSTSALTPNRTLSSLYIDPIVEILERQNPITRFHPERTKLNGVFDTDPEQPLILLLDFKTSGSPLWPYVEQKLSPLRERGFLTHWNGSAVVQRLVTVVASGNAPFDLLTANATYREIFYDAPLESLAVSHTSTKDEDQDGISNLSTPVEASSSPTITSTWLPFVRSGKDQGQGHSVADPNAKLPAYSAQNSYYASVSFKRSIGFLFRAHLSPKQLDLIRAQIKGAHDVGLKVRYWGVPSWPLGIRNHVWHVLIREGADMLNVDDLTGATRRDWRKGKGWWY